MSVSNQYFTRPRYRCAQRTFLHCTPHRTAVFPIQFSMSSGAKKVLIFCSLLLSLSSLFPLWFSILIYSFRVFFVFGIFSEGKIFKIMSNTVSKSSIRNDTAYYILFRKCFRIAQSSESLSRTAYTRCRAVAIFSAKCDRWIFHCRLLPKSKSSSKILTWQLGY